MVRLNVPTGTVTDFAFATASATSLNPFNHALGATEIPLLGINQSSPPASIRNTCKPRLLAVRIRAANTGWSLRKKLPITNTRSNSLILAIGIPNHGAAAAFFTSVWRNRVSI